MRPITRRLRILAALLGLAQGAAPALLVAHELAAAPFGAAVPHAESQGATHDVASHAHDCGICRTAGFKVGIPPAAPAAIGPSKETEGRASDADVFAVDRDDAPGALPRAPPLD